MENQLAQARALLAEAKNILVITGAGISAESGLPTYRGVSGLYNHNHTAEGISIEEAISGPMLRRHPEITWKYLKQIEEGCRGAQPNQAHRIIAGWEQSRRVVVFTQNIDHLHHRAGSTNVIDIHGDLFEIECMGCRFQERVQDYEKFAIPPHCPSCGGILRPAVVLFEEMLPQDKLYRFYEESRQGFDLVFSIGTTSVFPYIAQPVVEAYRKRIPTIEINPDTTQVSDYCRFQFRQGAVATLTALTAP